MFYLLLIFSLEALWVYFMPFVLVFLWGFCVCEYVCLCIYICLFSFFFDSFLLFPCLVLIFWIVFYPILFIYFQMPICILVRLRKTGPEFWWVGKCEGSARGCMRAYYNQNMICFFLKKYFYLNKNSTFIIMLIVYKYISYSIEK